jgi:hypothetical protein
MARLDQLEKIFFSEDFAVPVTLLRGTASVQTYGIHEEAVHERQGTRANHSAFYRQITVPTTSVPAGYTEGDRATYVIKGQQITFTVLDVYGDNTQTTITFEE